MTPENAVALVKKYAEQNGVRKTARIFNIDPSTVSGIFNGKTKYSGLRIAAKVAAAGTFICPELKVLMLPEVCQELKDKVNKSGWHGLKQEHRKLLWACPDCKIGADLCQAK